MKGSLDTYFTAYRYLKDYKMASLYAYLYQYSEYTIEHGFSKISGSQAENDLLINGNLIKAILEQLKSFSLIYYKVDDFGLNSGDFSITYLIDCDLIKEVNSAT